MDIMSAEEKELYIREKSRDHVPDTNDKISWSLHAVKKLRIEGLRKRDIEDCLKECITIEDYTMEGRTLPGCLILSFIALNPIHAVIAIDRDFDRIFVITVYKPSIERWENDWKTRKTEE